MSIDNRRVYIIAEAGVNHNGSLLRAQEMVKVAAYAGADAIKFQTFKAESLVSKYAPKAEYQLITTDNSETQYDMLKKLELNLDQHKVLLDYCKKMKIEFLSTPFDIESLNLLVDKCSLERIKISSGEITNAPFLLEISKRNKPVILSTGMSTLSEIEMALGVLAFGYLSYEDKPAFESFQKAYFSKEGQNILREKVWLLHCTTEYPTPYAEINLKCIATLRQAFRLKVGYSDHSQGIAMPLAAVALGASVIEKHFTLDKNLDGPDHKASLNAVELKEMISGVRQIELALGDGVKIPTMTELKNRSIARKSLIAKTVIRCGDSFTHKNIAIKRPGDGKSPFDYWDQLTQKAIRDYKPDEKV